MKKNKIKTKTKNNKTKTKTKNNKTKTKTKNNKTNTKTKTKTSKNLKHTYLVSTKNIKTDRVDQLFNKRGNWIKSNENQNENIDFIYIDTENNNNQKLKYKKTYIKNFIDNNKNKVGRKNELYRNLGYILNKNPNSSLKKYLLEQHSFNWGDAYKTKTIEKELEKIKTLFEERPNKIWIYKPVEGYSGINIKILNSNEYESFETYIHDFIEKKKPIWNDPLNKSNLKAQKNWVLQEYITNPLLYHKKKMHIRPVMLYHKKGNNKVGYILDKILVAHAVEDYKLDDLGNQKIHDTHLATTPSGLLFLKDDFLKENILTPSQVKSIENQVRDLATYIFDLINSRCYPDSKQCFETFGMDLIIDKETLTIKLMEVQITKPTYGSPTDKKLQPEFSNMFEYILENAMETVVDYYFPPSKTFKKSNGFKKFYEKRIE